MNCWAVLELQPGVDRAQIKRAYAAKLKVTRPDVDPEGFKRLHAAYKTALSGSARALGTPEEAERSHRQVFAGRNVELRSAPGKGSVDTGETDADAQPDAEIVPSEQVIELDAAREGQLETDLPPPSIQNLAQLEQALADQIDRALVDRKTASADDSWCFLECCDELNDIQLRSEFSLYLFGRLLERAENIDADSPGFAYLNEFFAWTDSMHLLGDAYGYEAVESWLEPLEARHAPRPPRWICPKNHPGPIEWAGYYARIGAALIDWLLIVGLLALYGEFASLLGAQTEMDAVLIVLLAVPVYLVGTVLFEASPVQGTPGKVFMGLKVTTRKGRRAHVLHILLRTLMYSAAMAAIKITVWINFFLADGRLLHDRLSGTIVIKRF